MPKPDWKAPFLHFREEIRPLFDANVTLYHGIVMAPFHEHKDLKEVVQNLDASFRGKTRVAVIETPTDGCKVHAHYFFGDNGGCKRLGHALSGIDDWMRAVPKDLLPRFNVRSTSMSEHYRNLATWASLVYYLAWEIDAPYLQAAVEHQANLAEVTFAPWSEWPQPDGCDPRPILIHQGDTPGQFEKMLERFSESEEFRWCPDIIDAYLIGEPMSGEFIAASLAAVDVLVFMLDQIRGQESAKQNELSTPIRKKSTKHRRVSSSVEFLKFFLRNHHNQRKNAETALIPLTWEQIAEAMEWFNEEGKPLQAMTSRRMAEIFGSNPMKKYRMNFINGEIHPGLRTMLGDGSLEIDGIVVADDDD